MLLYKTWSNFTESILDESLSDSGTCAGNLKNLLVLFFNLYLSFPWASLAVQMVNNLPAIEESQVWSLGWEDPLKKGMATHSSILAWEIPWTEEPRGL